MSIWWEASAFLLLVVCFILRRRAFMESHRFFPPSPSAWPVIGHLHLLLRGLPHHTLGELSREYGPIMGLRLGQQLAVVVSTPALARQVLSTHDHLLSDRPPFSYVDLLFRDDIGLARRGSQWRIRRKLCVTQLFTARRLREQQHVRQQELAALLQTIDRQAAASAAVHIHNLVGNMAAATLLRLVCSSSNVSGEDLRLLVGEIEQACVPTMGDFIPWLSFSDISSHRHMRRLGSRLDDVLLAIVRQRKQELSQGHTKYNDLLQALLAKEMDDPMIDHASQPGLAGLETITLSEIIGIMKDMLAAGINTTAITVEWAMAELMRNVRCLRRLQQELDEVEGAGKQPQVTDEDLPSLPYLKWVVKEVFRLHPAVALLIPRISTAKCDLDEYSIPTNTLVFVNVWAIGRDEQVWSQASQFRPERFEGTNIDVKGHHYELLPFGSGRRACIGLPLGLSSVEITLANLVKTFDWELPPGETSESINMDEKKGFANSKAHPLLLVPKPRT